MKITILTALWGRPHITSIMLDNLREHAAALRDEGIDLTVMTVGSEGAWSRWLAYSHGAEYVQHENKPLGKKWNMGMRAIREREADGVVILGSDNIVNAALLRAWATGLHDGIDYQGILDSTQYHPKSHVLVYWPGYRDEQRAGEPCGSGRCFSRRLLDLLNWKPWRDDYNRGLDWSTTQKLKEIKHTSRCIHMADQEIHHLGIKTSGTMSGFVANALPPENRMDPEVLVEWFGDVGDRVLALRKWPQKGS